MPLFRSGKPWRRLSLAANSAKSLGAQDFGFDAAASDGDWTGSDLTSSVVNVDGLYVVTCSLATTNAAPSANLVGGIYINGAIAASQSNPTGFNLQTLSAAWCGQLVAGDSLRVRLSTLSAGKTFAAGSCHLTAARIGPVRWT